MEKIGAFDNFSRGCHGSLAPGSLNRGYFHKGVNLSVRNGQAKTRPRWVEEYELLGGGEFQGAFIYSLNDGDRLVYGRGGEVRLLELWSGEDFLIGSLSPTAPRFYFVQADRYCIVQDGENRPLFIYESGLLRRAEDYDGTGPSEVYTGTVMTYGHGRVFLTPSKLHDLDGQPTGETGRPYWVAGGLLRPSDPERVLLFDETQYLDGGTANALPFETGFIQGLAFFQNAASGTGLGPLLAFGRQGVSAVSVNVPRSAWFSADFSQVLFVGPGTLSPESLTPVNNDLIYRSLDGLRSVRLTSQSSASNTETPLAVVPMSQEVSHRLVRDDEEDLPKVSGTFSDNFFLVTTGPKGSKGFDSLIALDTAPASAFGGASSPAYADIWTGPTFRQVLSARGSRGTPTPFAVVEKGEGFSLAGLSLDEIRDFGEVSPKSRIYLPATAGSGAQTLSEHVKFLSVHLNFREVKGPLKVRAYYRADEYPRWSKTDEYDWQGTGEEDEYSLPRVSLGPLDPATGRAAGNGLPFGVGQAIQVCVEWEGVATLASAIVVVNRESVDPSVAQTCFTPVACEEAPDTPGALLTLDDYDYEVTPI